MAAQNQHYVPKFVLRQFLSDPAKERVAVYDKHEDRTFITSIKNVMAERRFHDFDFDEEWRASFEPVATGAENMVLPAYRQVLEERRLDEAPEQKAPSRRWLRSNSFARRLIETAGKASSATSKPTSRPAAVDCKTSKAGRIGIPGMRTT